MTVKGDLQVTIWLPDPIIIIRIVIINFLQLEVQTAKLGIT